MQWYILARSKLSMPRNARDRSAQLNLDVGSEMRWRNTSKAVGILVVRILLLILREYVVSSLLLLAFLYLYIRH